MTMDLIILGIFLLTVIVCVVRGFARTLVSLLKGVVALAVSWFFCDDLTEYLIGKTEFGGMVQEKINQFLGAKWETSQIYKSLPELFKGQEGELAKTLVNGGSEKLSVILITIASFIAIWLAIQIVLKLFILLFSKKNKDGRGERVDGFLGFLFGIVIGAFNVFLFLALLVPVTGFIIPNKAEMVMGLFDGSKVAQLLYDKNLLLILFRDFILTK